MDEFSMEPLNNFAIGNIFIYFLCFSESHCSVSLNRSKGKNIKRMFPMNLYCISFMRLA